VFDAVDSVFQGVQSGQGPSQAFVCIRPPGHHCSSDFPSGFCWLNNVHIGIQHAIQKHGLTHAAIIDFDLHHGDGSQEVAWGHNEHMFYPEKPTPLSKRPFIGYYSLHDINSFPCEGGDREKVQNASLCIDNAHGQSIWNVHLRPWKTLDEFWELYEQRYLVLLEKARAFLKHQTDERLRAKGNQLPKAAIFISAGFDASEHEGGGMQRHKVNVPTEFYARFTKDIVALAQEQGTSVEGRVISVLEGGYSNKALMSGVLSHISGLCDGSDDIVDAETELINGMASIGLSGLAAAPTATSNVMTYNTEWWHSSNLDILDSILDPTPIAVAAPIARKVRLATYSSPTQASTLRAIDPLKVRLNHRQLSSHSPSRPASPPPPDVDWQTAATELSNLLIPSDRETRSHTAVQLAEPKVKKERPSASSSDDLVPPTAVTGGRTLRDRKPKATTAFQPPAPEKPTTSRKSSVDRRKTIAEALPNPKAPEKATRVPKRRTSIASTVSTTSVAPHLPKSNAHRKGDQERPRVTKSLSNGIDVKKTRLVGPQTSNREMPPIQRTASANTVKMEPPESSQGDVMDELTSSIKRITIKVPSNEEYASRQKKAGVNGNSKALASKRAPALKASGATKGASNAVGAKKTSLPTSIKSIKPASNVGPQEKEALVKNEPTNGSTPIQQPPAIAGSEKDRVVPEMEQQLQPPHQYPVIQWLAPNTDPALPTEAQDQVQLPQTYSGTEFIPFMPPGSQRQQ
jgi:histone deacetylase HOS3